MRPINYAAVALVKRFESFRAAPYLCPANVPTIGYGTTTYPDGKKVSLGDPDITEIQAEDFLCHDMERAGATVVDAVKVRLSDNQFGALVSLTYNIGSGAFQNSTLLRKLNGSDYASAAEEFLKWIYAGGQVMPGLIRRRQAERSLFLHQPSVDC